MHLLPITSAFQYLHIILTLVLAVYIGKSVSAPALNSAEIRSLIDPVQQRNPDENFEDPGVVVRSLFFFREKCKPGTQLSADGKCLQVPMRDSTVTSSHAAFQLALNHVKRKPKPHRKTPRPDQGTETVPTEATTTTATTTAMFAETERTTFPTSAPTTSPTTTTTITTTTPLPYFVEVYTERYTTLDNPPEGSETTQVPGKYFESTTPLSPTTTPTAIRTKEVVPTVVPILQEIPAILETTIKAGNDTNQEIIPDGNDEEQQSETIVHTFSTKESESTDSPAEEEVVQNTDTDSAVQESDTTQLLNQFASYVPLFRDQGSTSAPTPLVNEELFPIISTPEPEIETGDTAFVPHTISSNEALSKFAATEQALHQKEGEKSVISALTPGEIQGQAIIDETTPAPFDDAPTTPETIYMSGVDAGETEIPSVRPNKTDEESASMDKIVQHVFDLTGSLMQSELEQVKPSATAPSVTASSMNVPSNTSPLPAIESAVSEEEQPTDSSSFPSVSDIYKATMPPAEVYEERPADIFREQPIDTFQQSATRDQNFQQRPVQDFQQERPHPTFAGQGPSNNANIFQNVEERPLAEIFQHQAQNWEQRPAHIFQERISQDFDQQRPLQNFQQRPAQTIVDPPSRVIFPDESNEAPRQTRHESPPSSIESDAALKQDFFERSPTSRQTDQNPWSVLPGIIFNNHPTYSYRYPSSTGSNQPSNSGRIISYHTETQ